MVDTQGLFDNETTMGLTAAIFGMSTLLSSYSIYNVSKVSEERALLVSFSSWSTAANTLRVHS